MKLKKVPEEVQKIVNNYINLRINGKTVQTPYYRNIKRIRAGLRVLVGKGSPEEIQEEALIYAKLKKVNLNNLTNKEIRTFLLNYGLGIDCSGFVAHLIHTWLKSKNQGGLGKNINYPSKSLYRKILTLLRAIESTGADVLTNKENTKEISVKEVLPGDLLRLKALTKGDHVALIYSVYYQNNLPVKIKYVHSSEHFFENSGVKFGKINILDPYSELKNQQWLETNKKGDKPTYQQLLKDYHDNGLRRLNCLKALQND